MISCGSSSPSPKTQRMGIGRVCFMVVPPLVGIEKDMQEAGADSLFADKIKRAATDISVDRRSWQLGYQLGEVLCFHRTGYMDVGIAGTVCAGIRGHLGVVVISGTSIVCDGRYTAHHSI